MHVVGIGLCLDTGLGFGVFGNGSLGQFGRRQQAVAHWLGAGDGTGGTGAGPVGGHYIQFGYRPDGPCQGLDAGSLPAVVVGDQYQRFAHLLSLIFYLLSLISYL